jgi:hypothetical protein
LKTVVSQGTVGSNPTSSAIHCGRNDLSITKCKSMELGGQLRVKIHRFVLGINT